MLFRGAIFRSSVYHGFPSATVQLSDAPFGDILSLVPGGSLINFIPGGDII